MTPRTVYYTPWVVETLAEQLVVAMRHGVDAEGLTLPCVRPPHKTLVSLTKQFIQLCRDTDEEIIFERPPNVPHPAR